MTFVTYHMASYDHMIRVLYDLAGVGYTPMSTLSLHKKWSFTLKIFQQIWANPFSHQFDAFGGHWPNGSGDIMYSSSSGDISSSDFKKGKPSPHHHASNFDGHSSCDNGEIMVAWLVNGWKLFKASHHLPKFSDHCSCGSRDITYLFFQVF